MKRAVRADDSERKGARTRARIVREAATLFNTRGFAGTSVSDVSAATGLEKGGVYNHFDSKDDLALAAFDYAAGLLGERLATALHSPAGGPAQLAALLDLYRSFAERPPVPGGCPIMNTALDADDTHPALRERTCVAMTRWLNGVAEALERGRTAGDFRADIDVRAAAGAIVAALEGAVLLAKIDPDGGWLRAVTEQLAAYIDGLRPVRS